MPVLWVTPEELDTESSSPYAFEACKAASYVMWAFSGRKYHGIRTVTERYECPCRSMGYDLAIRPYLDGNGNVYNQTYVDRQPLTDCNCSGTVGGRHARLRLRGTPVRSVQRVLRNDEELDPSTYKIVNSKYLQLTGTQFDVCGLEVTYTYGVPAPVSGRRAARTLARELVKGWSDDDTCALPDRIQSIDRQGISIAVMDPQDFLDEGRTGLYEVDLFLRAANPDKARKPAKVFSPDLPKPFRVTAGTINTMLSPYDWKISPGFEATWTLDLASVNADILLDPDWEPQGQITTWNGSTLFEFDPGRFDIEDGVLTVTLTASETSALSGSSATWNLYGLNTTDGFTLVHILDSTVHMTGDID